MLLRHPLSVVANNTSCHSTVQNNETPTSTTLKHKRVTFDANGTSFVLIPFPDMSALLLEGKHNKRPSTLKMSKFTETIDLLKSASAWDKFSLTRFGVDFKRTEHTALTTLITDQSYYDPRTETRGGFVRRCFSPNAADGRL